MKDIFELLHEDPSLSSTWRKAADGRIIALLLRDGSTPLGQYVMTEETLASQHPMLKEAVEALIQWKKYSSDAKYVEGRLVIATLKFLKGDFIEFETCDGHTQRVLDVFSVTNFSDKSVQVCGDTLQVEMYHRGETPIPCVTGLYVATHRAMRRDIEKRYPNWEVRKTVGEQLGLELNNLMRYAFSKEEVPAADVSSITFD